MAISGDFIVGFPGETEAEFQDTLAIVRAVGYASAYSFKYSPRPGTPAADQDDQVPEEEKLDRLHRLQALLLEQQQAFNRSCVGKILPRCCWKSLAAMTGQMIGRSPISAERPHGTSRRAGPLAIGALVETRILAVGPNSLSGQYAGTVT